MHELFQVVFDAADPQRLAAFWAEATNARQQRQYEEAMADHRRAVEHYHRESAAYEQAIEADPTSAIYLSPPWHPVGPTRPTPVTVPTAAGGYQPTN